MKIGICDDNILYLKFLDETVNKLFLNTKGIFVDALNPSELSLQIKNSSCPYDIIITDIDMGTYNGINFAKEINLINSSCIIIFVSNFINFATEVYDVQHIYFVLKSEAELRLPKALEKAFLVYDERISNFLTIRYQNVEFRISLMDITHIEALGRYLYIHDIRQSYKCINSLKAISAELSESFSRCHNSYIVNLNYIHSLCRTNCILSSGTNIPISQTYWKCYQAAYIKFVSKKLV